MLMLCGDNAFTQLGISSNNKNKKGYPIVSPPSNSHLEISDLFSFSLYSDHSVWITHHGKAHAVGSNYGNRICASSKDKLKKETKVKIKNSEGHSCRILSAVCGEHYTLYLLTSDDFTDCSQLAYMYKDENMHNPLFINLPNHHLTALFGGAYTAAAIDSDGALFLIDRFIFKLSKPSIKPTYLPEKEKAVCACFCGNLIIAVSDHCRVFKSSFSEDGKFSPFVEINELIGKQIVDVNGTFAHCFAVSGNGKVYGLGSNEHGRLGMGPKVKRFDKFNEIKSLKNYKIIHAYAGLTHSLFQTHDWKLLGSGTNGFGELLLGNDDQSIEKSYDPIVIPISNVSFCIAGAAKSAVFVNCDPPPHCPNRRVLEMKDQEILEMNHRIDHLQHIYLKEHAENKVNIEKIRELEKDLEVARHKKLGILDPAAIDEYSKVRKLGHGSTSEVFQVSKQKTYALKIIDPKLCHLDSNEIDHTKMTKFIHEYEVLHQLDHPNIIKTFGISFGDESHEPVILLEFCPFTLKHIVSRLTDEERIRVILEITDAMATVHAHGIIHSDLRLQNILLDENKHVRVSDFGVHDLIPVEPLKKDPPSASRRFMFMAPEMILGFSTYDQKVDVFAFGTIFYVILMKGKYPRITLNNALNGKKAHLPKGISDFSRDLIEKCWSTKPKDRPTFAQILDMLKENENEILS